MRILVDPFDEAEKLSRKSGKWVIGIVETRVFWPKRKQTILYDGKVFLLLPAEHREGAPAPIQPAIAIKSDEYRLSHEDARSEILRFASSLSWRESQKIEIISWSGGNLPRSIGIMRNVGIRDYLDEEHLPVTSSETAKTALAFYREGISLDNPFYSFLSLYKAFSIAIPDGRTRDAWMTANCSRLDDEKARKRLSEIEDLGTQVGTYLYEKCRHAIAHADKELFVNPDNTDDHFRLTKDIPLMRNFAELAIEESFAIKRASTIRREHLFELEGFRHMLPEDVLKKLKDSKAIPETIEVELPDQYFLTAKKRHEQHQLPKMSLIRGGWIVGGLILDFQSEAGAIELRVMLDFKEEKLRFDPLTGFRIIQNRDNHEMAREEIAGLLFQRCIFSNGHIEIWDSQIDRRLGCSESYIPVNFRINDEYFEQEIAALKTIIGCSD